VLRERNANKQILPKDEELPQAQGNSTQLVAKKLETATSPALMNTRQTVTERAHTEHYEAYLPKQQQRAINNATLKERCRNRMPQRVRRKLQGRNNAHANKLEQ